MLCAVIEVGGRRYKVRPVAEPPIPTREQVAAALAETARLTELGVAKHLSETIREAWAKVGVRARITIEEAGKARFERHGPTLPMLAVKIVNQGPFGVPLDGVAKK